MDYFARLRQAPATEVVDERRVGRHVAIAKARAEAKALARQGAAGSAGDARADAGRAVLRPRSPSPDQDATRSENTTDTEGEPEAPRPAAIYYIPPTPAAKQPQGVWSTNPDGEEGLPALAIRWALFCPIWLSYTPTLPGPLRARGVPPNLKHCSIW